MNTNKYWFGNYFLIKYLFFSTLVFFTISFQTTKAQIQQGYNTLDSQNETLQYKALENDERFDNVESCYNPTDLLRYPDLIKSFNTQAICFDKYSLVNEYRNKISAIDESLQVLHAYKKSTEKTLGNIQKIFTKLKSGQYDDLQVMNFFILPKGQMGKISIEKTSNHKPVCKINTTINSKNVVQSCQIKTINFDSFQIINNEQTRRIYKNISEIQSIFKNSNGQKLGLIDTLSLISKAGTLSNDLIIFDSESYLDLHQTNKVEKLNEISSSLSINITNNNKKDSNNPSNKILKFSLQYPNLNDRLQVTNQNLDTLPDLTLEKFIKEVGDRVQTKLKDRITEYNKLIAELEKNKKTQEENISLTKKDTKCFDQTKIQEARFNNQESDIQVEDGPQKLKVIDFAKDQTNKILKTMVRGVKTTYNSVSDKTIELISFTPTPTPESPISKFLKTVEKDNGNNQPINTPVFSPNTKISNPGNSTNSNSYITPTPQRAISNTTPTPTNTLQINTPSPSPSSVRSATINTPTPTPTPTVSPTITSTPSPSPTSTPITTPTPYIPTPAPIKIIETSPNPSPTPSNQSYIYSKIIANSLIPILDIIKYRNIIK